MHLLPDDCNSLVSGCHSYSLKSLQLIQNDSEKVLAGTFSAKFRISINQSIKFYLYSPGVLKLLQAGPPQSWLGVVGAPRSVPGCDI